MGSMLYLIYANFYLYKCVVFNIILICIVTNFLPFILYYHLVVPKICYTSYLRRIPYTQTQIFLKASIFFIFGFTP